MSKGESGDSLKTQLEVHHRRAEALQKSLKDEIENTKQTRNTLVLNFDLEQALPVPNLSVGPAFYLRKAWTYNLCGLKTWQSVAAMRLLAYYTNI